MIKLYMAAEEYEQDIRPLVKSFFPDEELEVVYTVYAGKPEMLQLQAENKSICVLTEETKFSLFYVQEVQVADKEEKQIEKSVIDFTEENAAVRWHKYYRDEVKRALYRLLSRVTGKTLPW